MQPATRAALAGGLLPLLLATACATVQAPAPPPGPPGAEAAGDVLRIGVVGDQTGTWSDERGDPDMERAYAVLRRGVEALTRHHREVAPLDLVLHVGDLVENLCSPPYTGCSEDRVRRDFRRGTALLDDLPVPWYLAAGDHDVNPPRYRPDSPDRSREALFEELYGPRIPGGGDHLWYSFDVARDAATYHVVVLHSSQALWSTPRFGNVFLAQLRDDQLRWLERDLERSTDAAGVVVLLHHPLWYHWSGWQRVHDLLRRHPVALVLAGHLHYQQAGGTLDGVTYLTVGATGGKTKSGSRQAGDVQHVSVVEVRGHTVAGVELIALDGRPLELTPRREMDRVQALDVTLGNLGHPTVPCDGEAADCCPGCDQGSGCYATCTRSAPFAALHPVRLDDGELVSSCGGGEPARLEVVQIGNPIDRPLEVRVSVSPEAVTLAGPTFHLAGCGPGTACTLPPASSNVRVSNTSGVELSSRPPLWTSGLALRGPPPDRLTVAVELSYTPDSTGFPDAPLKLQSEVTVPIRPCP